MLLDSCYWIHVTDSCYWIHVTGFMLLDSCYWIHVAVAVAGPSPGKVVVVDFLVQVVGVGMSGSNNKASKPCLYCH